MTLNRGSNCNFPCPVCLVPNEELSKGKVYALCTTNTMKKVYNEAIEMLADDRNDLLKSYGLQNVEVCKLLFWLVPYSHYKMWF